MATQQLQPGREFGGEISAQLQAEDVAQRCWRAGGLEGGGSPKWCNAKYNPLRYQVHAETRFPPLEAPSLKVATRSALNTQRAFRVLRPAGASSQLPGWCSRRVRNCLWKSPGNPPDFGRRRWRTALEAGLIPGYDGEGLFPH